MFSGEPFERMVALLIALVAIFASIVAYLESDAGRRSDMALRDAQQYSLQAVGVRTRGEINVGYALNDAYRTWLELDTQAFLAEQNGDAERRADYLEARDYVGSLTPLLGADYFDADSETLPDIKSYESATYIVESALLTEQFEQAFEISDAWDGKAQNYVTQLTLLTVTLFLYGLSTTVTERSGYWFVVTGTVLSTVTLVWGAFVLLDPIEVLPQEAMDSYAMGVGLRHSGKNQPAILAFDQALKAAPDYADAYYERAQTYEELHNYAAAIADYEAAQLAGRNDTNLLWNLGWAHYIEGNLDAAVVTTKQAIEQDPMQVALHFNLGLMHLANGAATQAVNAYDSGSEVLVHQVMQARNLGEEPPASLWWYMSQATVDIDNLTRCIEQSFCTLSPPQALLSDAISLDTLTTLNQQIKSLNVAVEYGLAPPQQIAETEITNVAIAQPIFETDGETVAMYQPLLTNTTLRGAGTMDSTNELADISLQRSLDETDGQLFITFDYADLDAGQLIVSKVYRDNREVTGLRLVEDWKLNDTGQAVLPLTSGAGFALEPGNYRVDLYVDAFLHESVDFVISSTLH